MSDAARKRKPRDDAPADPAKEERVPGSLAAPLGDDRLPAGADRLTASRQRDGLPSGSKPAPDGGVGEHPVHDEPREDFNPDDYETLSEEARESGFEPREPEVEDEP